MAELALQGTGLIKSFGGITAVGGVDVQVAPGHIVGVLGPNGSGKTTLMSMLAGLVRPDRGRVEVTGRDVTGTAPFSLRRRPVACTLQNPRVFASLTVQENLELALYAKRRHGPSAASGINEILERLHLAHVRSIRAGELSGGQRKLVDLARALVVHPRVLLADEPTAGVSHAAQTLMAQALSDAAGRGTAVLLVSHDLPWTFSMCQRIMFLTRGELLVEGSVDDVRNDPRITDAYLR
jgi:ABC-type branched-subunit amino acid transport system ATPase component